MLNNAISLWFALLFVFSLSVNAEPTKSRQHQKANEKKGKIEEPIDWPKDGKIDSCHQSSSFDYRNAYWMAAASYYSYLEPAVLKQIVDAPRGKKVKIQTITKEGKLGPTQMVYGLGWQGHFDFFTSKPILPKTYKSKFRNVVSLFGKNLPYEACIKKEKRPCVENPDSFASREEYNRNCGANLEFALLDRQRLRNITKLVNGSSMTPSMREIALMDKASIEENVRAYEQERFIRNDVSFEDEYFEVSCEEYRFTRDLPPDVQALWLDGPESLMIAFRGTEIDNPIDWATDLATSFQLTHKYLPFWERNVHKGFKNAYTILSKWLLEEIEDFFKRYPRASEVPVFITGHSMGGAIATIATTALLERNTKVPLNQRLNIKALYTYGSPRVGSEDFARYFDTLRKLQGMGVYRIVNKNDVVTKAPCLDYQHLGTHIQLLSSVQGNFPATKVQVLVNPQSEDFRYCAYGSRLIDNLNNFKTYSTEHSMQSYYSVLVKARSELNKALQAQAEDYQRRYGQIDDENNPYHYPNNCSWKRIYKSDAPAYLQQNYRHFPFIIEK